LDGRGPAWFLRFRAPPARAGLHATIASSRADISSSLRRLRRRAAGRPPFRSDSRERPDRYTGKLASGPDRGADAVGDAASHAAHAGRLRSPDGRSSRRRLAFADPRPPALADGDPGPGRDRPARGSARPRRLPPPPAPTAL